MAGDFKTITAAIVPDHDLVRQMFDTSLKIYAPHVKNLDLL